MISLSDIIWGSDEADGDRLLDEYFVEVPGYKKILSGEKRFIIGRKGTGKTAILEKIRIEADKDAQQFYNDVSLRDFPLNDFKGMENRGLSNKSKYVSAWQFILLIKLIEMILQDCSLENTEEFKYLARFVKENFPRGISVAETIQTLKRNENKLSIIFKAISGERRNVYEEGVDAKIHFNQAVQKLEEILKNIRTESTYYLLIDELDEGYQANLANLNAVILALLRAVEILHQFFAKVGVHCLFVVALRSDIFENLEDNDLNKLDDYVLRLNWTTFGKQDWSLKDVIEQRIRSSIGDNALDKFYWPVIAGGQNSEEVWKHICSMTFCRPRDIIKFMKYCSEDSRNRYINFEAIQNEEFRYSEWFYNEFRDEVQSFLKCWASSLNCLSEIAKGKAEKRDLLDKFDKNTEIQEWCKENHKTSLDVMKILFNYSVIGCINEQGRWIFKYKDSHFQFMESYPYYCIHYGFCRKLRINRSYDRSIIEALNRYR